MKNNTTFNRILNIVGKFKLLITFSLLFSVVSVILSLYIPVLAGRAIDIIDKTEIDYYKIIVILIKIALCALISAVLQWILNVINNKIAYKTVKDLRNQAFSHIQSLPLSYIDAHPHGDIVSRIITDAEQFSDGLILGFSQLFTGIVTIIITFIFMLMINPTIALAVVILTPLSIFTSRFIAKKSYKMFRKQTDIRGEQTSFINEMIKNQKTVQSFSYENTSIQKFDEINKNMYKYSLKAVFFSSLPNPTTRFINNIIYAVVGFLGAVFAISGTMSVGGFVSFLAYSTQYTKPFNEISGVVTEFQNAMACAARIFELIDEKTEQSNSNSISKEVFNGTVNFNNLFFSYNKNQKFIEDFNFNVKSGEKIAIVGPTGCGKTTLINLLMRFYDPDSGQILFDNIDIKEITRHSLRKNIGMVLQDTWIMNGTVRENIALGKPASSLDEVILAAKEVKAHSFIMRLKNGYDTFIGDDTSLSEGERQLICIARVMLMKPPMLILDEATSSIDTLTEIKVQNAFNKLMKGRTCFIVAHRLSTIMDADSILVMRDGNIVETGTHKQLIEKGGFYNKLYNSQFAK